MIRHSKKIGRHTLRLVIEAMAIFAVIVGSGAALMASRLQTGPLDVNFAIGYIEQALQNKDNGNYTTLASAQLEWPDFNGPLILRVGDLKFFNAHNHLILSMGQASLSLSKPALLLGQIIPVGLIFEKPELHIVRHKDGELNIGFTSKKSTSTITAINSPAPKAITDTILQFVARPGNGQAQQKPLPGLETFEIRQARIRLEDRASGREILFPSADFIFKAEEAGVRANFAETFKSQNLKPSFLYADLLIPWDTKGVYLRFVVRNMDLNRFAGTTKDSREGPLATAPVDAELGGILDSNLTPLKIKIIASSDAGYLSLPALYANGMPYNHFNLLAQYEDADQKLVISNTHVTFKGVTAKIDAQLLAEPDRLSGPVKGVIDEMPQDKILPLWPNISTHEKAKRWLTQKISGGVYKNLYGSLNLLFEKTDEGWRAVLNDMTAGFDFENTSVDYRPPMIPVTQGKGHGLFDKAKDTLHIDVESAAIGEMKVGKSTVDISRLIGQGAGEAALDLKLEGPLKGALDYLSKDPINFKSNFDALKAQGNTSTNVKINFPTIENVPVADVKIEAQGTIDKLFIPGVMKDLDLTGGPFSIAVKDNQFAFKGTGQLGGDTADLEYNEFLHGDGAPYKNKVSAKINAGVALRDKMGIDLSAVTQDTLPVTVTYIKANNGTSKADLLIDLTPAQITIAPFNYNKKAGVMGQASLTATLENGILKEVSNIKIKAPDLNLDNTKLSFSQKSEKTKLVRADIENFKIGNSQGKLSLDVNEDQNLYKVDLDADYFNLQPFLESKGSTKETPALQINLKARKLGMANDAVLNDASIFLDRAAAGNFNRFEFKGGTDKAVISISFKPDESGKRVFDMSADDAGLALRAFGAYKNMRGGTLKIKATPMESAQDRNLSGKAEIKDFTIAQAPTLARLLGALSLPGVMSVLNDQGLSFSKMQVDFNYLADEKRSVVNLKNGRTSGNALGITFDGQYDRTAETIDINGTIVPLSEINNVIASIPLIGDILSGGSNSIFAATYSVRGPVQNPDTSVNPLAVLAPGIIRRILFE